MRSKITRERLDGFLKKHANNLKIVDIGSGNSSYSRHFPNRIMVDVDPARKPDIIGDAHNLPFRDGEVEAVLSTDVFEHLKDPVKAVSEMKRVLKTGGLVIFATRFIFPIHDSPGDFWRFSKYGLRELFKDFDIIELQAEAINFEAIAILFQRLGYQTEMRLNKVSKFFVFLIAQILLRANWLIRQEYGDIGRKREDNGIIASGYYMVAKRK